MEAFGLIRAHLGAYDPRQIRRNAGFQFAGAATDLLHAFGSEETLGGIVRQLQGMKALGLKGKYMVDIFLSAAQIGFVTAYIYFIITSIQAVVHDAFGYQVDRLWFGKDEYLIK